MVCDDGDVCEMPFEQRFHLCTHLSCAKSSFEIELDHTGQGLKSTQKGQGAAYLLCRPYEIWPFSVLA